MTGVQTCALPIFGSDLIGLQFFRMRNLWLQSSNVHRHVFQDWSSLLFAGSAEQNAGLAIVMSISANRSFDSQNAGNDHLFADLTNDFFQQFTQLLTWTIRNALCEQFFRGGCSGTVDQLLDELVGQENEVICLGHRC